MGKVTQLPQGIPFPDDLKEMIAPQREVIKHAQEVMAGLVLGYFQGAKMTGLNINLVAETYTPQDQPEPGA